MRPQHENTYDIFWPVHYFSKLVGYGPQTYKRSKNIYDVPGIIIVIVWLMVKGFLVYINIDSKKFSNITNSSILNYGIWMQIETTLLLSIFFILMGLRKYEHKWKLWETFNEIDEELVKVFHSKLFHKQTQKWMFLILCYGAITLTSLIGVTIYLLSDLPLDNETKYCIFVSIFLSNVCILATANQFNSSQMFIFSRYNIINNILMQLLFDSPEMKKRNKIITNDPLSVKELQYTKYINNFPSENSLRDQLEISSITKNENILRKKEDLKKQKIKMDELKTQDVPFVAPFIFVNNKSFFSQYTFSKNSPPEDIKRKVNHLFILHDKLTDCVDILNDMDGLEMQLVTLSIFVYVVFGLFSRYCVWMNYQKEAASIATMNICWMCVYVHTLVFSIFAGTFLVDRAKETPLILHRIMCTISDVEVLDKLYQLSEMLYTRQPVLGCGLLAWDWEYLFSLIGGVCMYLIILIQFYVSSNN